MSEIVVLQTNALEPYYQQVWQLREDVLRIPLGLSLRNEDLSMDQEDVIFVALLNNVVVGCVMLHPVGEKKVKLRQMAVATAYQGQNIGRKLVLAAEKYVVEHQFQVIELHARLVVKGFYEALRYTVSGPGFQEVGIDHVKMIKAF